MTKKDNKKVEIKKEKKYFIIGLLYLICGFLWINFGIYRIMLKETYIFDLIIGIILVVLAIYYYMKYKKNEK